MSRWFLEDGRNIPVTLIEAGPCVVTGVRRRDHDGYDAVQLGFEDVRPARSTMPIIGHDAAAGSGPLRYHREVRLQELDDSLDPGERLDVSCLEGVSYVDVTGTSKGKGFQGPMKRYRFKGLSASHGVKRAHRSPGSIGGRGVNLGTGPKPKLGLRMAGRMGGDRVTARSLEVVSRDPERNLLVVKGAVPGPNNGMLIIKEAKRLNRRKTRLAKHTGE